MTWAWSCLTAESQVGWMGLVWNWNPSARSATSTIPATSCRPSGKLAGEKGIAQMTRKGGAKDMLGGAAWMTAPKDDEAQLQHAFSLLSFTYEDQPGVFFGPYFDDKIKTLFDYAAERLPVAGLRRQTTTEATGGDVRGLFLDVRREKPAKSAAATPE